MANPHFSKAQTNPNWARLNHSLSTPNHFRYDLGWFTRKIPSDYVQLSLMKEPELPKVDILVPAKTLVERKKATGMDDQEFFFEERFVAE